MEEKKKKKIKTIFLYVGLGLAVLFTIITSIVVNYKRQQLEDLKNKNQQAEELIEPKTQSFDNEDVLILIGLDEK